MTDSTTDQPRERVSHVRRYLVDEWASRTTYGKLWFPAWLLQTALILSLLWSFFTAAAWLKRTTEGIEEPSEPVFEVYQDDE